MSVDVYLCRLSCRPAADHADKSQWSDPPTRAGVASPAIAAPLRKPGAAAASPRARPEAAPTHRSIRISLARIASSPCPPTLKVV
ncbi:hypothetical protein SLG_27880 [Sphingobium sp. SYK-6]|nr:hypothetical protein SLG_27880 [Sphingobium sp. SYK-6]